MKCSRQVLHKRQKTRLLFAVVDSKKSERVKISFTYPLLISRLLPKKLKNCPLFMGLFCFS